MIEKAICFIELGMIDSVVITVDRLIKSSNLYIPRPLRKGTLSYDKDLMTLRSELGQYQSTQNLQCEGVVLKNDSSYNFSSIPDINCHSVLLKWKRGNLVRVQKLHILKWIYTRKNKKSLYCLKLFHIFFYLEIRIGLEKELQKPN